MTKEQKRDAFIEAFLDGQSISPVTMQLRRLVGMVYDLRSEVKGYKEHIAYMDDIARDHEIKMNCRSCGEVYVPDCELSELSDEGNYCGRSERCCP